jgi:hypothetical protein
MDEPEFYHLLDNDGIADDIHQFKLREWRTTTIIPAPRSPRWADPYEGLLAKKQPASLSPKS